LSGCSTSPYQKQVSDLSTALTNVQSSFESLSQTEQQTFVATQTALALQKGNEILIPPACSEVRPSKKSANNCIPIIHVGSTNKNRSLVYKPAGPNALKLATAVAEYGKGLVTLAQAQDVTDLNAAVGKTEAAVTKLASDAKIPTQQLGAIGTFVGWAFGEALNELRVEQLRRIVNEADPVIAETSKLLSAEAAILKNNIIVQKSVLVQQEQTLLFDMRAAASPNQTAISASANTLISDATALQTFADTDVTQPFIAMRKAHAALLASLNNPQISADLVFAQVDSFLEQASNLKTGLENSAPKK
jgi:hypothetical protein